MKYDHRDNDEGGSWLPAAAVGCNEQVLTGSDGVNATVGAERPWTVLS